MENSTTSSGSGKSDGSNDSGKIRTYRDAETDTASEGEVDLVGGVDGISEDDCEKIVQYEFRHQMGMAQLTRDDLVMRALWPNVRVGDPENKKYCTQLLEYQNVKFVSHPIEMRGRPSKFIHMSDEWPTGMVPYESPAMYEPEAFHDPLTYNSVVAIHEYRELAVLLNEPPAQFLDAYYNYAKAPAKSTMVSGRDAALYQARFRCDWHRVYIAKMSEEEQKIVFNLNMHPSESNAKIWALMFQFVRKPPRRETEASE